MPDAILTSQLRSIVGDRYVHSGQSGRYTRGYRTGRGEAECVVRPGSLVELWKAAQAAVSAGRIIIVQAANTGLTGGSTPWGDYDRGVVVINTMRLSCIHLMEQARQVICLPGATLSELDRRLQPLGREPHSEIGSSCIGASVVGGVCNNSGGALVRRGPAYTEAAMYARLDEDGTLRLVNELGIDLGDDPETQLTRLEQGDFGRDLCSSGGRACSAPGYDAHVRDMDAGTPARFNADPRQLHGASGSAGRLIVFALRLDTFPRTGQACVFHVAVDNPRILTGIRRSMLSGAGLLPVAAEYMHRDIFRTALSYGKDTFLAVRMLGTDRLPLLFGAKAAAESWAARAGLDRLHPGDRILQALSRPVPHPLRRNLRSLGTRYTHHLLLKVEPRQLEPVRDLLRELVPSADGAVHESTPHEGQLLFLHRFAAAGAAIRYANLRKPGAGDLVALDVALRRNDRDWEQVLPDALMPMVAHRWVYGHFFCHVFHQDFILRSDADPKAFKQGMLDHYAARGAQCPAEHNVGHIYQASPGLAAFYRSLDPTNSLNPGIGLTPRNANWI